MGLSVRQGNLQEGLADYPDGSFDWVILSQTLPFLNDPAMVLREMLRVGKHAIISFSNWGHWRCRLELLLTGRIPVAVDLPQQWYEIPRRQPFTVTDFARFCRQIGIQIERQVYMNRGVRIHTGRFRNLLSTTAVFTLGRRREVYREACNREETQRATTKRTKKRKDEFRRDEACSFSSCCLRSISE